MSLADTPRRLPLWQKLLFLVPVIGGMARELIHGPKDTIWYALATLFSAWGSAILLFGLPGLYLPAVAMVPIMFVMLILITWA